jgi:hypothetical protein
VELLGMDDPMAIEVGTRGTVLDADDVGQLIMKWDNGRGLSLIPRVDQFRIHFSGGNSGRDPDHGCPYENGTEEG